MRDIYYNIEDAEFTDGSGEKLSRFVPKLFYQENAVWRIFLRDRENRRCDLSGIVAWSAAVAGDYDSSTAPMCRVLPENISADTETGSVTVTLDAATAEFLAAVDGTAQRKAFFEMHGLNAAGDRELYLGFEISARMILDPAPGTPQQIPETFATRIYVDLTVDSSAAAVSAALRRQLDELPSAAETRQIASAVLASGGYVNSGAAATIAGGAAASAASGAIKSGAEFTTTVGGYTVALTSGGGLVVSGSGASVVLSGGEIKASGARIAVSGAHGEYLNIGDDTDTPVVSVGNNSVSVQLGGANAEDIIVTGAGVPVTLTSVGGATIDGENVATEPWVGSQNFARQLVTSTTAVGETYKPIEVLSGGTMWEFPSAQIGIDVYEVTKTTEASFLHFTLDDNVTNEPPVWISGYTFSSGTFEGGKEYLVGFFDGMCAVNEVTSGGVLQ